MTGVLSAGVGVCGVSAAVAAAPVVQAKSLEIAYTIGTILLFGVLCMFLFPIVGKALGMGYIQFGAWAGTGILNSAQVAGAALAFQPGGIETLKVAEIFNITRVLFLPIIVVWLAIWYVRREQAAQRDVQKVDAMQVVISKFPIFVLGFILMFLLSSTGIFAPARHYQGAYFDNSDKTLKRVDKRSGKEINNYLKDADVATLTKELEKIKRDDQRSALQRLIDGKKIMTEADDDTLRGHRQRQDTVEGRQRDPDPRASRRAAYRPEDRHVPRLDRVVLHLRSRRAGNADHHVVDPAGRRPAARHRLHRWGDQGDRIADRRHAAGCRNHLRHRRRTWKTNLIAVPR